MNDLRTEIYLKIDKEIKDQLDEIDIEGMISFKKIKGIVSKEISDYIKSEVAKSIQNSLFIAMKKQQHLIDDYTADKVKQFMRELNSKVDDKLKDL